MEEEMEKKPCKWETLPSLALSNIFRNLNFKDRFGSIPLVCKAWNSVISEDPRCWSSMIPDSISPEDAFIKKPDYSFQINPPSKLYDREGREIVREPGVSYLRNFIKKSSSSSSPGGGGGGGGSSSTITSLCLDPFSFSNLDTTDDTIHQDEILGLIAQCCPNLKHISFDGFCGASIVAVVEVFRRCKKIELIDFSDSGYEFSYSGYSTPLLKVIKELGKWLPDLRGIRIAGWMEYNSPSLYDAIATHLPRIKLLALDYRSSRDEDFRNLTSETNKCRGLTELQYLSVGFWEIDPLPPVCSHIPEFHYEKLLGYECEFGDYVFQPLRSVHQPNKLRPRLSTDKKQVCHTCLSMKEEKEAYSQCSIMKPKKVYEVGSYNIPPQDKIHMRTPARSLTHVFWPPNQVSRPYQPRGRPTRPPSQVARPYQPKGRLTRQFSRVCRPYQPQGRPTRQPSQVARPYQPQGRPTRQFTRVCRPYQPQGRPTRPSTQVPMPYQPQGRSTWQVKYTHSPRGMRAPPPPQHLRAQPIYFMRAPLPPQHMRAPQQHMIAPQYMMSPQHMMSLPHGMRPPPFGGMRPPSMTVQWDGNSMSNNTMTNNITMNNSYAEPQHGYGTDVVNTGYDSSQQGSSFDCNTQPQW